MDLPYDEVCHLGANEIGRLSPADRAIEEAKLRRELNRRIDGHGGADYHRMITLHYLLGFIRWLNAGSPQPMPRFV